MLKTHHCVLIKQTNKQTNKYHILLDKNNALHFKGSLKQFVKKLKKSPHDNDISYTVREKIKLTDHTTGQELMN